MTADVIEGAVDPVAIGDVQYRLSEVLFAGDHDGVGPGPDEQVALGLTASGRDDSARAQPHGDLYTDQANAGGGSGEHAAGQRISAYLTTGSRQTSPTFIDPPPTITVLPS